MTTKRHIELLAPAKNLSSGKVAINYGADAVYIGADKFGARAAACNSVADIEELVRYAHLYNAKVFVTLNTLLYDEELEDARQLIHEIYEVGADALIIQDMAILKMDIPPIPLHASTQTHNFELEKIHFLDAMDLERIVLARELSLPEVKEIHQQTQVELEYFIHGALCVSLSGQCYFSQTVTGRSANRGNCAQMCRHPYNLVDSTGKRLALNKHLLSLKDLNMSANLKEIVQSGITSLKIEGRLKDEHYVKNVVSYYRQLLDRLFSEEEVYKKASTGKTKISFTPDPERSFNRQSTDYFFKERSQGMVNPFSPKSMGKILGRVTKIESDFVFVKTEEKLNNGDGLCFIHEEEVLGVRVEKVINNKVYLSDTSHMTPGLQLYRNYDHEFSKSLEADKGIRKIDAHIKVMEQNNSLHFLIEDEDGLISTHIINELPEKANNEEKAKQSLQSQLAKSGNSMFTITAVEVNCQNAYFFRFSELNEIRRILFEQHEETRIQAFARKDKIRNPKEATYPKKKTSFSENIANKQAAQFYVDHGVLQQEKALEIDRPKADQLLMTMRYCIKYEMGFCERFQDAKNTFQAPLYLEDQNRKYLLEFDCKNCMMHIRMDD